MCISFFRVNPIYVYVYIHIYIRRRRSGHAPPRLCLSAAQDEAIPPTPKRKTRWVT